MLPDNKEFFRKLMLRMNTMSFAAQLPVPSEKINRYVVIQKSSCRFDGQGVIRWSHLSYLRLIERVEY